MAFLDETGLAELWSITKAKAMPTKETAALFGLGEDATVDDVLQVVAQLSAADGLTMLTVLDEDGAPIQNVTITGLVNKDGETVTTDVNGQALVVCTAATETSFDAPYWDIPPYTETVQPLVVALNNVTITMPYLQTGEHVLYTASETKQFRRAIPYDICVVGGGGGGGALYFSQSYSNLFPSSSRNEASVYGGGGGAVNSYYAITPTVETDYEMVVGAGGSGGVASGSASVNNGGTGGTTTFLGCSAVGGNGAGSIYHYNSSNASDVRKTGSKATAVSNGTASGATATVYPFGDSTIPAGGGGGCGYYETSDRDGVAYGGNTPCGGGGGWKHYYTTASPNYRSASATDGLAPGGGGGGHRVYNSLGYSTSYTASTGKAGGAGGVYIRRPAEEA